jgi:hypothetical protein
MTVIKSSVFNVLEKFPDRSGDIKRLFKENREFQTVCEDYRQCAEALQYWNQSDEKDAPARRQEYSALAQELAAEILQHLNESIACRG